MKAACAPFPPSQPSTNTLPTLSATTLCVQAVSDRHRDRDCVYWTGQRCVGIVISSDYLSEVLYWASTTFKSFSSAGLNKNTESFQSEAGPFTVKQDKHFLNQPLYSTHWWNWYRSPRVIPVLSRITQCSSKTNYWVSGEDIVVPSLTVLASNQAGGTPLRGVRACFVCAAWKTPGRLFSTWLGNKWDRSPGGGCDNVTVTWSQSATSMTVQKKRILTDQIPACEIKTWTRWPRSTDVNFLLSPHYSFVFHLVSWIPFVSTPIFYLVVCLCCV